MQALVEQHRALRGENARLRRELEALERRVGALDEQVMEMAQRRQDVGKRTAAELADPGLASRLLPPDRLLEEVRRGGKPKTA